MVQLPSGARLEGDAELVYRAVDDEQAGGDGVYVADIAEATSLPEDRVRAVVEALVEQDVLRAATHDAELGPQYVLSRAV